MKRKIALMILFGIFVVPLLLFWLCTWPLDWSNAWTWPRRYELDGHTLILQLMGDGGDYQREVRFLWQVRSDEGWIASYYYLTPEGYKAPYGPSYWWRKDGTLAGKTFRVVGGNRGVYQYYPTGELQSFQRYEKSKDVYLGEYFDRASNLLGSFTYLNGGMGSAVYQWNGKEIAEEEFFKNLRSLNPGPLRQ